MKRQPCLLIIPLLLVSCSGKRLNFDKGIIPPVPVNFTAVNSMYDDYNSDLQITWSERTFSLFFSTNRNSSGNNFDFTCYSGHIMFGLIMGDFEMTVNLLEAGILEEVNTDKNEYGPFFTADYTDHFSWKNAGDVKRFFWCSDPEGSLDILCCKYELGNGLFTPLGDPFPVTPLNTEHNEGYLSLHNITGANRETVYFMSDRNGSFDIWRAIGEEGKLINESSSVTVARSSALSSNADDKCPYICGNMIVFASDRPGGYGGFDLWYSVFNGQQWSAPANMGDYINTEFDEYRPVVVSGGETFINDFMVFSSNRPGGNGGYDLYYAGIPRR